MHKRLDLNLLPIAVAIFEERIWCKPQGVMLILQIKKGQFDISVLCPPQTCAPQMWESVLAA